MINGKMTEAESLRMWLQGVRETEGREERLWYIKHVIDRKLEEKVEALSQLEGLI